MSTPQLAGRHKAGRADCRCSKWRSVTHSSHFLSSPPVTSTPFMAIAVLFFFALATVFPEICHGSFNHDSGGRKSLAASAALAGAAAGVAQQPTGRGCELTPQVRAGCKIARQKSDGGPGSKAERLQKCALQPVLMYPALLPTPRRPPHSQPRRHGMRRQCMAAQRAAFLPGTLQRQFSSPASPATASLLASTFMVC